jgi:hypothetical protein
MLNHLLSVIAVDSIRDLLRYKSFFLLILIILGADNLLHLVREGSADIPDWRSLIFGSTAPEWFFSDMPGQLLKLLGNAWVLAALVGLFLLKQLISLWPSSDMRRIHRQERKGFGIVKSLVSLRIQQLIWDACAVAVVCVAALLWSAATYIVCREIWHQHQWSGWLWIWLGLSLAAGPLVMAGLSFSSKIAVLSRGSFGEKLKLFYQSFYRPQMAMASWVFFGLRIVVEGLLVAVVPTIILLNVENYPLRIMLAGLLATTVYAYLKMATFKFFLFLYRNAKMVNEEYPQYYAAHPDPE